MNELRAHKGPRTIVGLVAAFGMLAALAMPVMASDVKPEEINSGNPTCGDFNAAWDEVKIDPPQNGTKSDGTLTVTITDWGSNQFDWESNIGVDAVFVKAGSDKHHLYLYDPEATSDDGLTAQAGNGNGISHISFCYDADAPASEAPPSEPAESQPAESQPAESQPAESQPAESQPAESEAPASESPREGELGGTPTPAPSAGELPDTAIGVVGQTPATVLSLVLLASLAGMVYVRLARQR